MTSQPEPQTEEMKLRRVRKKRRKKERKQKNQLQRNGIDMLLFIWLVTAVVMIINPTNYSPTPFPSDALVLRLGGFILLILVLILGLPRLRHRINYNKKLWGNTCPTCDTPELKRTQRQPKDRFVNKLGFPTRRYICANCGWRGARIDSSQI